MSGIASVRNIRETSKRDAKPLYGDTADPYGEAGLEPKTSAILRISVMSSTGKLSLSEDTVDEAAASDELAAVSMAVSRAELRVTRLLVEANMIGGV